VTLTLHDYWRSSAAYRVRIALNLKGLDYAQVGHDLLNGEHHDLSYRTLNPQGLVPALEIDGLTLTQSPAVIEWLEERYPKPHLLPRDKVGRAVVRAMTAIIGCDIHPLNNLRVLNRLRSQFGAESPAIKEWIAHWIGAGFEALESHIEQYGEGFAFGDRPTIVDCFLVPQAYSAERFGVDTTPYPRLMAAVEKARALPAVAEAHPDMQPGAPG
jgi:maleylpyruvate isomerase